MRQHLTGVQAAAKISGATVQGAELGSKQLTFEPSDVRAGDYPFSIGTAGSTSLNWSDDCLDVPDLPHGHGPGNVVMLELESDSLAEIFTAFGLLP